MWFSIPMLLLIALSRRRNGTKRRRKRRRRRRRRKTSTTVRTLPLASCLPPPPLPSLHMLQTPIPSLSKMLGLVPCFKCIEIICNQYTCRGNQYTCRGNQYTCRGNQYTCRGNGLHTLLSMIHYSTILRCSQSKPLSCIFKIVW